MFTGIISEIGTISGLKRSGGGIHLSVTAPESSAGLKVDDSVALNGVCQTVIRKQGTAFTVEAVEETLKKTTLGSLQVSSPVNLELPLRLSDRLGGHLVLGHVDGVGVIRAVLKQESSWLLRVEFPPRFSRYVIPVGSIAVDGISLTVAAIENNLLTLSIIPHTLEKTTLAGAAEGMRVNLEFDLIGKYIERMFAPESGDPLKPSDLREKLREWGYAP